MTGDYIDAYRTEFGVEPICAVLSEIDPDNWKISPSTYYAAKSRPMSARAISDIVTKVAIFTIWQANYEVYGVRKMWKAMRRGGADIGRDQVGRLMREMGIAGARRGKRVRTTCPDDKATRPPDLVNRDFTATAPNQLWVTDLTYVPTWSGMVYVSFITDVFSRTIVGWRVATNMRTDMVLESIEMARWSRGHRLEGLICHSDAGGQYTSVRYTERLEEIGATPSIGSVADSYDNALAETINGLYKTEVIHRRGPWKDVDQVELATLNWVHWFNNERLHSALGDVPPVEFEAAWHAARQPETEVTLINQG